MLPKDKLRKADIFSGGVIFLFGLWIAWQAFKMPMKDSWGGVQNVWFVSPAIFPLFVGVVVAVLGALLSRTGLKTVGRQEFGRVTRWLLSQNLLQFLTTDALLRFYAISVLFLSYVYLNIPRIDFFLCSILFLTVFITMFYLDDELLLKRLLFFYLAGICGMLLYFAWGIDQIVSARLPYASDLLTLCFLVGYCVYAWMLVRGNPLLRKKYRTALIVALAAPLIVGPIFKYFLLVPMPTEGLVIAGLDYLRYFEF